ncbi:allophanate hydrolase subunit 1 [Nocardioides sp. AE5]|uniref:5-oxoprolinase subunit B family protein n=1 Tax=Nocardioides sp. AE5 TaxID=2962573 RepID=UPI00288242E6|nr:allophanate hydrolase subunit 1 [Nocardioides sp. AE5]MDT0201332.1 allophanate hydrolase subunit 1 [Nocardioides sp. AE5]
MAPRIRPFGDHALLVEVEETAEALDLALWAREQGLADDVVPATRTVLLDGVPDLAATCDQLATWRPGAAPAPGPLVEVPLRYDGPDLAAVARGWGMAPDEAVARHTGADHVVAFCGFAPGFPYLTSDLALPDVPRLDSPRARVEPGSVGLAGPFTGIYPGASPGGWQLIGHTDEVLWDSTRAKPALLPPGTRVRFVAR